MLTRKAKREKAGLLAIDIGNSAMTIGLLYGRQLVRVWSVQNRSFPKIILKIKKSGGFSIKKVILCSVVPKLSQNVRKLISDHLGLAPVEVGREIRPKIKYKYFNLNRLGKDRLVNIWGATRFYKLPVVVVDFGTAITLDYISEKGVFEGGLILPGLQIALDSLHQKTALLPWVRFKPSKHFLGRDTVSGMQNAVFWGWVEMINGLLIRFKSLSKKKLHVVLTGGMAPLFHRQVRGFHKTVVPYHTLRALAWLAKESQKKAV